MNTPLQNTPSPMQEKTTVMSPAPLSHGARGRSFESDRGRVHAGGGHWRETPGSKPNGSRGHRVLIALGIVLAVLIIAYGGGVVLFGNVCYPNTVIADTDVSLMTRDTAISRVRSSAEGYRLTVEGDGFTWTFDPESASEVIDAEAAVDRTIGANDPFEWPVRLVEALSNTDSNDAVESSADGAEEVSLDQIDLPQGFDRDAFLADLDAALDAFNETRTGTFDAAGAYDADAGKFTLEKARSNQRLDKEAIEVAALRAISTLSKSVTLDEGSFVPLAGGASESELQAAIDQANSLIGTDVDLKMGGSVVATLDGATFVQWMTFDESLKPTLSTEPLAQWVRDLAETKLDTIGCQRTYTRPDGKVVTVSGGTYGWNSDEQQLVTLLQEAVANKQVGEIDIPTLQNAAVWTAKGEKDWGAYCDIDLTEQHCRYYDASGNILWESGCVTGNPNEGDATPTGVYILNAKRQNETLIGMDMDKDGEPDYRSPVAYWMPFVGNLIGLHDASWQSPSVFTNPTAYLWAGSHGCINLPTDKAGELYNLIQVGDCVIVHN